MKEIRKYSDLLLALFVMAVAAMLLVPLPTVLLDLLITFNIACSLLLLLVGLYLPNALALLSFPSLLLLSTLFRLSLNVASTRLILSQGDAGRVIEAFGTFLVQGEVVVGVIIFTIITIVNFIVIARGAGRVSEVAARFALDALPGKQMAIDADLRSGLITALDAQTRREDLRRESQFYGAMDGSMKFVQGDAIAGFFIILTNILGGIYIGVSNGLSFGDAVHSYTVLTVGDGLVTQIPAILISICAGIVVTRVSSKEDSTLSSDLAAQLFRRPATVFLAGTLLLVIATLPGLPFLPFMAIGAVFIGSAWWLHRSSQQQTTEGYKEGYSPELPAPRRALGLPTGLVAQTEWRDSPLVISVDGAVLYRLHRGSSDRFWSWWRELQAGVYHDLGIKIPDPNIVSDERLAAAHYAVSLAGSEILSGSIPLDSVLVEVNPEQSDVFGFEVRLETDHPVDGSRVFWAQDSLALRRIAQAAEIRALEFMEFIALRVVGFYQSHPEEALTMAEVHSELKELERRHPGLLEDSIDRRFLTIARLTEILQELVRHGIGVRDIRQIVGLIASYCSTYAKSDLDPSDFDRDEIVAFIRGARRRQIIHRMLSERRTLRVVTLSESAEEALLVEKGDLGQDAERARALRDALGSVVAPLRSKGRFPVVVLCKGELRERLMGLMRILNAQLPVLAFEELEPLTPIERVGVWHLS
jgi:type III secretion protein V